MQLSDPVTNLAGVGPKLAQMLNKCHIYTIQDLLFHLPYRYQDRTRLTPIRDLREHNWAVVEGTIIRQEQQHKKRRQLVCFIQDQSHLMRLRFFHYYQDLCQTLSEGTYLRAFGEVRWINNHFEMVHPEFQVIAPNQQLELDEHLTPIYSVTQGLSQYKIRRLIEAALQLTKISQLELLPNNLLAKENLPNLYDSLFFLHHPPPQTSVETLENNQHPCQIRLAIEELLGHHLAFKRLRDQQQDKSSVPLTANHDLKEKFLQQLPYKPTQAQQRVLRDIEQDLAQTFPTYRLVQGDVGSGKTLVAALSCLPCLNQGGQVAVMAPTELLAEQLYNNLNTWLSSLNFKTTLLLGKHTTKQKKAILEELQTDTPLVIVGTHALFQQNVVFSKLRLVIIDEQHRFGVKQRLAIQEKGVIGNQWPHQILMTATPIPRTLAMAQYASLDISIIDELPPGRTPIQTAVIDGFKRDLIVERLLHAFAEKKQAYWVCTLIEESEKLQCQAAEDTHAQLSTLLAPYKIGLVHGRMKAKDKLAAMQAFLNRELDCLVATTVIEVGVDVPNASLMIIENAERLGLSQLHQLRGRVGRGNQQSHCILLYQTPLSDQSQKRLSIMRSTTDGFIIAEEDLNLRGSGEIIGTKQTGLIQMKVANFKTHQHLLNKIPLLTQAMHQQCPDNIPALIERWLADGERYIGS